MLTFLNYRLYKTEGKLIPEFRSVAEFMVDLLDDCSGGTDGTYMTLRVGVSANEISRGEHTLLVCWFLTHLFLVSIIRLFMINLNYIFYLCIDRSEYFE